MKPNTDPLPQEKRKSPRQSVRDSVASGVTSVMTYFLATLYALFVATPESIKKHKPGERGNSPPPTGGISSL